MPAQFILNLPPEEEEGHYADFANIWHNNETFILDFAAMTQPPTATTDDAGNPVAQVPARIVTRVRIPAVQVWEVMKGLESQLSAWEREKKGNHEPPSALGDLPDFGAE